MANQIPSRNLADEKGGMAGMLRAILDKAMQGIDGQLPAVVVSYDAASNRATVRPDLYMVGTDGGVYPRADVASVPVLAIGAGGFALRFPIKPGDRGWIEASDRDISTYLQGAASRTEAPPTRRTHSFSDGRFIPDSFALAVLAGEDAGAVVLQSYDGSVRIAMDAGGIRIYGPVVFNDAVTFNEPVTALQGLNVDGVDIHDHGHTGVQTGSGISGGAVNL